MTTINRCTPSYSTRSSNKQVLRAITNHKREYHENQQQVFPWVICPFAGGSSAAFSSWQSLNIDAQLFVYPGRDQRMGDTPIKSINALAEELTEAIMTDTTLVSDCYILCGHSMGGQVAYEACLLLEKRGKAPHALVLSACHAPHLQSRRPLKHLTDQDFVQGLVKIGGCSPELAKNKELLQIFLPMLRADFIATESYVQPLPTILSKRINTSTILVNGINDDEAHSEELDAWYKWITHNRVTRLSLEGNHFYITSEPDYFIQRVNQHIYKGYTRL